MERGFESLSVLLREDDVGARATLRGMLKAMGVGHVIEAGDEQQAYRALDCLAPDVMLCGEALRSSDALALVRGLRRRQFHPMADLPVILLLDRERLARAAAARAAGVSYVLLKPLAYRALRDVIRRAMAARQPFIQAAAYCGPDRRGEWTHDRRREADTMTSFGVQLSAAEIKVLLGN